MTENVRKRGAQRHWPRWRCARILSSRRQVRNRETPGSVPLTVKLSQGQASVSCGFEAPREAPPTELWPPTEASRRLARAARLVFSAEKYFATLFVRTNSKRHAVEASHNAKLHLCVGCATLSVSLPCGYVSPVIMGLASQEREGEE